MLKEFWQKFKSYQREQNPAVKPSNSYGCACDFLTLDIPAAVVETNVAKASANTVKVIKNILPNLFA
jgi:hypothetical protein